MNIEIFTKGMLFIFLPILIICGIYWSKIYKYARYYSNDKEKMRSIKISTHIMAIIIFLILFVINICFAFYFNLKITNLTVSKLLVFLVFFSPCISLVLLLYNIAELVMLLTTKKNKELDVL